MRFDLPDGSLLWIGGSCVALILLVGAILMLSRPRAEHVSVPLVADALATDSVRIPITAQAPPAAPLERAAPPRADAAPASKSMTDQTPARGVRWWRSETLTPAQVVRAQEVFAAEQHRRPDPGMAIVGLRVTGDGTRLFVSPETPAATRALLPGRWVIGPPPDKGGKLVIGHGVPARRYATLGAGDRPN